MAVSHDSSSSTEPFAAAAARNDNASVHSAVSQQSDDVEEYFAEDEQFRGSTGPIKRSVTEDYEHMTVESMIENQSIRSSDERDLQLIRTVSAHYPQNLNESQSLQRIVTQHEGEIDPRLLDWDGPDDPENPILWSKSKKWFISMATSWLCLVMSFGSSLYVSGTPELMEQFRASQTLVLAGLTFYLLGLSFGPVIGAPLSELFGRRIVYISSLPMSMLFTMGVGLSKNIHTVLVLRFFAGFFGSPAMAVAGGTISDLWAADEIGIAMTCFCMSTFMGPVLGPIVGGYVAEAKGWKWTMWVLLMFSGLILGTILVCPETYKSVILRKRAKKRNIRLKKIMSPGQFLMFIFKVSFLRPVKMLFVDPIISVFSIYIAFVFAVLFGFFEAYPVIFVGVYGIQGGNSSLPFIGIGVGLFCGGFIYVYIDRTRWFTKNPDGTRGERDQTGKLVPKAPEVYLLPAKIGAIILPISLFWLGWTARPSVHWICPTIAGAPFGCGMILIFFSVMAYFVNSFPPLVTASALAANNLARYVMACIFPLFTVQMYHRLGVDWASSLFGFIAIAMVPVPWIFERYGAQLRKRSQFGFEAIAREMKALQEQNEKQDAHDVEKKV